MSASSSVRDSGRPARAATLGGALITPLPRAVANRLRPLIDLVIQGLAALGSPRTVLGMFLLSMPIWLLEAGLFFALVYSLGQIGRAHV